MFKKISIALVTIVALILLYATTKPSNFRVERGIDIKSSPANIFSQIDNLQNWSKWSPYEAMDPNMKKTFAGADRGKGASVSWEGNSKVGKGSMVITDSLEPHKIILKLNMKEPMKALNTVEFTLEEKGGVTHVSWEMFGSRNYFGKLMSIFVDCDKMIGADFEAGLENLKAVSEKK